MRSLRFLPALVIAAFVASQAYGEVIWVVGSGNTLVSFDHATPGTTLSSVAISGLAEGESVVGIDVRPASGGLLAMTSGNRIYNVNTSTGAATAIGSAAFTPALTGTAFGFDFNPTVDRIRVVSNGEQNIRLHPDLGTVAGTDTALAYATGDVAFGMNPSVVGVAYSNSLATATSTTLYAIDSTRDTLVRQGSINASPSSPNAGLLFTIGSLGVATGDSVGFDISSATGVAFAALEVGGSSTLYTIDLSTGSATSVGAISGVSVARGLAVAQGSLVYTVPIVGSAAGQNGTSFRSDLFVTNHSAFAATVKVDYYASSATANTGATATANVTVAAGEQKAYRDVLSSLFSVSSGTGALRLSASRPISVVANVYNDQRAADRGTFGQLVRASEESERRTGGVLPALSNIPASTADGARSNLGFFNPGTSDSTVTLTARSAAGASLGTAMLVIPALAHQQGGLSAIFPGLASTDEVYVTFTATSSIFAYASVVDNKSGDGWYVPAANNR